MSDDVRQVLVKEFADNLCRAIEGMTGERPKFTTRTDQAQPGEGWISWRQSFGACPAAAWLSAAAATWGLIGTRTLQAAGIDDSDPVMANSTFAEILGQAFSMLARSLSGRTGREWTCTEGSEAVDLPESAGWTGVDLAFSTGNPQLILLAFEPGFLTGLEPAPATSVAPVPRPVTVPVSPPPTSKTLDLLLDVELPVSVSFGRAQLALKDVIKLTTGSIVELNRTISEPVEVIVNNCVIARGEVVVVEGNFGVRIQQVVSREERLRTLF